jgi:hypothetical protein
MRIKDVKGTVLDYIFFQDFDKKVVIENLRST